MFQEILVTVSDVICLSAVPVVMSFYAVNAVSIIQFGSNVKVRTSALISTGNQIREIG